MKKILIKILIVVVATVIVLQGEELLWTWLFLLGVDYGYYLVVVGGGILAVFVAWIIMLFVIRNTYWRRLTVAWFFFSPLVLLRSIRKNTYKRWWISIPLIILSPITVFAGLCTPIAILMSYDYNSPEVQEYYRSYMEEYYSNPEVFEQSTAVKLPQFQVTEYNHCWSNFIGEFSDEMTIEFDAPLSDEFYQYLDSLVEYDDHWVKSTPDHIEYNWCVNIAINDSVMYKGSTGTDEYLKMYIQKGETKATISYGAL